MADIELNIPQLPRAIDGICGRYSYEGRKKENETKGQFAKRMLGEEFIIPAIKDHEVMQANRDNKDTIDADIDANIVIT